MQSGRIMNVKDILVFSKMSNDTAAGGIEKKNIHLINTGVFFRMAWWDTSLELWK